MPRTCTICTHPNRAKIEGALLSGESFRKIAKRSGTSITALFRHKTNDIPATLVKAREAEEIVHGDDLFSQIKDLNARTVRILDRAEAEGDGKMALAAIPQVRGNVELICKIRIAAEAARREEPEVADREFIESINLAIFGPNWREKWAEDAVREAAIERGEPVECPTCKHVGIMPRRSERDAELRRLHLLPEPAIANNRSDDSAPRPPSVDITPRLNPATTGATGAAT